MKAVFLSGEIFKEAFPFNNTSKVNPEMTGPDLMP
jgi:hypothetical protein